MGEDVGEEGEGRGEGGGGRGEGGGRLSCHSIPPHTTAGMQYICMIMCSLPVVSFLGLYSIWHLQ